MSGEKYMVHDVPVQLVTEINSSEYDAVVVITSQAMALPQALEDFITAAQQLDKELLKSPGLLSCPRVSGSRLVLSPTGPLTPYDDVRSVSEAVTRGMSRAVSAGAARALLVLTPHGSFPRAELVALLAALHTLYTPLQIRETFPSNMPRLKALGVYSEGSSLDLSRLMKEATALEIAKGVSCDVGGADPERMSGEGAAQYLSEAFRAGVVRVTCVRDACVLARDYPLFSAVNRAAAAVPRHAGCIVYLEYTPDSYDKTVMLVGKGVTYDTGGCDIKAGGAMAGMSRDKCGAAAVAGFLKACELLRPRIKVVAGLALVRNSVGSEAYVSDELLRSRAGLAVRIGNTDAEGRLAMADLLHEFAERAVSEREAHVYTVATLTGHAARAVGPYSIVIDNHAARVSGHAGKLAAAGEGVGDPLEVSTLRREDLQAHAGRCPGDDLHQADNLPSTQLARGHQGPCGFLARVSGLDAGGAARYSHLDVAGAAGSLPAPPTAAPLLALAAHYSLLTC